MKELNSKSHEDLERNLRFIHNETFKAIIESILRRRKKVLDRQEKIASVYT